MKKSQNSLVDHFLNLGVSFNRPQLLEKALTHRSFLNEQKQIKDSNERLEYLGDAVLELITSEFLFNRFPQKPEGELTSLRAKIVQTKTLSFTAQHLQLGKFLKLSKGEIASKGADNPSILADTLESVIGAIYLDQGFAKAADFVQNHLLNDYQNLVNKSYVQDWKSQLQELVQSQNGNSPEYTLLKTEGPDHNLRFVATVSFFNRRQAVGKGKSKQMAEQMAAQKALEKIEKNK